MLVEIEYFVTHFVVICDEHASFAASKRVMYIKFYATAVAVYLDFLGG